MERQFVPSDFSIPLRIETPDFILRKLTTADVEQDFEAVMSSKESLRQIFCAHDDWPADHMTLQDNYNDLKEHEDEFDQRAGFAYTVVTVDEHACLGCVYIYPWFGNRFDARVYYWVRDSEKARGLDEKLGDFLRHWLQEAWPINDPVFPGRDMSWEEWEAFTQTSRSQSH
ncbi:GNAT family N-acetyltransferase [candidate division CSSED10-310 bacterium]|uniref:GNAT family N-acetyltransferase n=1 Tax=candidate division CSSED10-310 bacterium TaxID=2855610 RepID=A0ABV6Z076_UNCC1